MDCQGWFSKHTGTIGLSQDAIAANIKIANEEYSFA
jgi:hypothetical protein